jgi:hypothetical protein
MMRYLLPMFVAGGVAFSGVSATADESAAKQSAIPIRPAVRIVEGTDSAVEASPVQFRRTRIRARGPGFRYRAHSQRWDPGFYGGHRTYYRGYSPSFYGGGFYRGYAPVYRSYSYRPYTTYYYGW